jgi:hypothetical protein
MCLNTNGLDIEIYKKKYDVLKKDTQTSNKGQTNKQAKKQAKKQTNRQEKKTNKHMS